MTGIAQNISRIRTALPKDVSLLAVSKFHSAQDILEAYHVGQRLFGESRVQELNTKVALLPKDIEWHFIGHLQTNKVRQIMPYIHTIQSVDSIRLLEEIERQAEKSQRTVCVLLEMHLAQETTKYGFTPTECMDFFDSELPKKLRHIAFSGLMTMASHVTDEQQIAQEFESAYKVFEIIKARHFAHEPAFSIRSWGMSQDYRIAIRHGANMIRIGTDIFGSRIP